MSLLTGTGPQSLLAQAIFVQPIPAQSVTVGDLIVALAVYGHARTDDFKNPRPERDFSAIVIAYFTKNPERLSLEAMHVAMTTFLWDASNKRQHPRLDKLKELWATAEADAQNAFLQLFVDQVVWVQRHNAGEFK